MNRKRYSQLLSVAFCGFISTMMCVNFVSADELVSQTENRELQQKPEMTVETLLDGSYMSTFETYLNDQFVGRDNWVVMKSVMERLIGKELTNEIFFAKNGGLINQVAEPDPDVMLKNAGYLNTLAEKVDIPVYMGMIPSAAMVWSEFLPKYAVTADEEAVIDAFYGNLSQDITTIPIGDTLMAHKDEEIFYLTDHHWTSKGAYYGYESVVKSFGLTPTPLSQFQETLVTDEFFGTIHSASGVRWVKPDSIHRYVEQTEDITVTSYFDSNPSEGVFYADEKLVDKDKYSYFLGGNQPLCVIETENTDAPSILVVRDSYSDTLAPFLTENFSTIHLLDLRYYQVAVSSYATAHDFDYILVLYSLDNFIKDNNLFKIGM